MLNANLRSLNLVSARFWMDVAECELLTGDSGFQVPWANRRTGADAGLRTGNYPFTLIFENDSTAVPGRGLPIKVAGRNVVKISMFLI